MRNILNIIVHDFKRLTSSVVVIVILMGIIVVPCLFAWFNIISNWDPFEPESTGRIPVAVATEDEGAEMLGMNINVGEKFIDAVNGNDMIGWEILNDKDKAIDEVYAGNYYAAVVIPEDFSDAALREQAQQYYDQGYLLTNIRTELQYWGYGLGFGDYVFTEGFDVYDNLNAEPAFNINVVKATQAEFNAFMGERMDTLSFIEKLEGDGCVSYRLSYGEDIFEITYYADSEILVQEHYFF